MVEPPCCGDALRLTIEKFSSLYFVFKKFFSFPPTGGGGKEREREKKRKREKERKKGDKE